MTLAHEYTSTKSDNSMMMTETAIATLTNVANEAKGTQEHCLLLFRPCSSLVLLSMNKDS